MKTKIEYLYNCLQRHAISSISIYSGGERIAQILDAEFLYFKKNTFMFDIKDGNMQYVIGVNEIEDIIVVRCADVIILELRSNVNVEIKINKIKEN